MAINKDKNINLQITISKKDAEKLTAIQYELSAHFNIELTKSQTIAYLIKNHGFKPTPTATTTAPRTSTPKGAPSGINYSAQIKALKDKMGVSFTRLSQILGIPESTLKKYASGRQTPGAEYEQIIKDALKKYGLK